MYVNHMEILIENLFSTTQLQIRRTELNWA